jgi:hypothetical protein
MTLVFRTSRDVFVVKAAIQLERANSFIHFQSQMPSYPISVARSKKAASEQQLIHVVQQLGVELVVQSHPLFSIDDPPAIQEASSRPL